MLEQKLLCTVQVRSNFWPKEGRLDKALRCRRSCFKRFCNQVYGCHNSWRHRIPLWRLSFKRNTTLWKATAYFATPWHEETVNTELLLDVVFKLFWPWRKVVHLFMKDLKIIVMGISLHHSLNRFVVSLNKDAAVRQKALLFHKKKLPQKGQPQMYAMTRFTGRSVVGFE